MEDVQRRQIADLQAVLKVSRELAATVELDSLLRTVEGAARSVLECERATVFLYDGARDELYSRLATGVDEIRFSADRGIAGEVVRSRRVINVPDAYADPRFNPEIDKQTGYRTKNILAFPLLGFDNSVVGVLQVLNKRSGAFDPWDEELVTTFGAQVGVAVQRQTLLEAYAAKQRFERDLKIARQIQQNLIPDGPPVVPGYDIAGWNKPADETGGDCYDHLVLPDGRVAITLADATGHGIGPALVIAECRALFHATIMLTQDLSQVVRQVNQLLCPDLAGDRFVTAFFGLLAPQEHTFHYFSAGQAPYIKFERATGKITEFSADGIPLGIMEDFPYGEPSSWSMAPGDMMMLITDGFFEWLNAKSEQFGTTPVHELIRSHPDAGSRELIDLMYESVLSFADGTLQADDLTAVVIRRCK